VSTQRAERIGEAIKRLVSELVQRRLKDSRITGMVSVTGVEVSGDLRHAKIFVSVYGDEEVREQTMEGLRSAKGLVRSEIAKSLDLRFAPDIQFRLDPSIERGAKIAELLQQINREKAGSEESINVEGNSAVNE